MKRLAVFLLMLIGLSCILAQNAKQTIAVLDLDPTGIAPTDAQFLSDRLRTELFQTGAFQVVERDKMNAILQEQGFQRTGCTTLECAVEIGQLLNVKIIVAGSIGKIEELYSISLRMIDVQSGMIIRTATQDYRGKLSDVLTRIIPEMASSLAREEVKPAAPAVRAEKKEEKSQAAAGKKFGVMLKGGFAFLSYTKDANDAIDKFSHGDLYFAPYSNHRNIAFEFNYFLSARWQAKLGIGVENILSSWNNKKYFLSLPSYIQNFEHTFQFANLGLGINYYLLKKLAKYDWYVGTDIGSMELKAHVTTKTNVNEVFDRIYTYNTLAFKLATGFGYFFSEAFRVGGELVLQFTGNFDLSRPKISSLLNTISIPPEVKEDILLLKKITGSGIQMNIVFAYYF
jgi:TolB-like protein